MVVHLLKIGVGTEDVEHLRQAQSAKMQQSRAVGQGSRLWHRTRNMPTRKEELLDGGSLYWVIKRLIRVRQRIISIESCERKDGRPGCALVLDPQLVRTEIRSFRPFQGWRYLSTDDTPRDAPLRGGVSDDFPPNMAAELRGLELL